MTSKPTSRLLLVLFLATIITRVVGQSRVVPVNYEYKIEVNITEQTTSIEDGVSTLENATLTRLEEILNTEDSLISVDGITSTVGDDCISGIFTSDLCSLAESNVKAILREDRADSLVEHATVDEVQRFVDEFNSNYSNIHVQFIGPFYHSTNVVLALEGVSRKMNEREIAIFEEVVQDVLDPLDADGSVRVTDVDVYYQRFQTNSRRRRRRRYLASGDGVNFVFMTVKGSCRGCSSEVYSGLVDDGIDSGSDEIRTQAAARIDEENEQSSPGSNGNDGSDGDGGGSSGGEGEGESAPASSPTSDQENYFDEVDVNLVTSVQRSNLPPAETTFDVNNVNVDTFPYWVLIILAGGIAVITAGLFMAGYRAKTSRKKLISLQRELAMKEQRQQQQAKTQGGDDPDSSDEQSPTTAAQHDGEL